MTMETETISRAQLRGDLIRLATGMGARTEHVFNTADALAKTIVESADGQRRSETFYVRTRQVVHYFSQDMTREELARILAPHYSTPVGDQPESLESAIEQIMDLPDADLIELFDEINKLVDDLDPEGNGWEDEGRGADVQGNEYQRLIVDK